MFLRDFLYFLTFDLRVETFQVYGNFSLVSGNFANFIQKLHIQLLNLLIFIENLYSIEEVS